MKKMLTVGALVLFGAACKNNVANVEVVPPVNVSFQNQVLPIFAANCSACHNSSFKQSNLDLSSYQAINSGSGRVYGANLVIAGDANNSGLMDAIQANPSSGISRMPQNRSPLSANQIETIKVWINEGALNN
jgi:mono/diheme cytochrome c family protein|tara:strand:- start:222 stop:617 length:396 start_codon:yes stop_codon:yes gene_type:complete